MVTNSKSHGAFCSYFELAIIHYLNHFQNLKLRTSVKFNAKIKVEFLFLAAISFFSKYIKVNFSFVSHLLCYK